VVTIVNVIVVQNVPRIVHVLVNVHLIAHVDVLEIVNALKNLDVVNHVHANKLSWFDTFVDARRTAITATTFVYT